MDELPAVIFLRPALSFCSSRFSPTCTVQAVDVYVSFDQLLCNLLQFILKRIYSLFLIMNIVNDHVFIDQAIACD